MRSILILTASLAIIVIGLWGTAVIYLDEERLKRIVAEQMMEQTGRKVEIAGALKVRLFPRIHLRAEQVVVSGPAGYEGPELLEADRLSMSVRMLPLIRGDVSAGQMQLSGARINLHTDAEGSSSLDGLAAMAGRADLLSSRQMRLEDITLVVSDVTTRRRDTIAIDWIELDRFSLDRAVDFRFRGNIGDPAVFREMQVSGLLYVPSTRRSPTRLANMRLTGELAGSGLPLVLLGNLTVSSQPPLQFRLEDGRLELLDERFDVKAAYDGRESPRLAFELVGQSLDGERFREALSKGNGVEWLMPFVRGMAIDATAEIDRIDYRNLALDDTHVELEIREGVAGIRGMAGFPGGVVELDGMLDGRHEPPRGDFAFDMEIADIERLMTDLQWPPVLSGTGMATVNTSLPADTEAMAYQGEFELWDGRWAVSNSAGTSPHLDFDRLAGRFRMMQGHLDIPEVSLDAGSSNAVGWAAIELSAMTIGGQLILRGSDRAVEISGSLTDPQFSAPLVAAPESSGAMRHVPVPGAGRDEVAAVR